MINFSDFLSQLLFSLFEVVAAAVILMFGWYFARVFGWYSEKYFAASKFYILFKRLPWTKSGLIGRTNWPRLIGEIAKWWLFLVFIAVCASIIGFGPVSRFLGKALEDSVRVAVSLFILVLAALAADHFPKIITGFRPLRQLRQQFFLRRTTAFIIWILSLLIVAFIAKLISLRKVLDWGAVIIVLAIIAEFFVEFRVGERARGIAVKIFKRFKKTV